MCGWGVLHRLGPGPHLLQKCLETDIPRLGNSAHQRCRREVDALLSFPVRTHSIITFTQRMAASGHGSVAHRVKLRLMVHMVPGSNPAWDFLSGKREGGLKPPEWLLVHKGPSLSLVPSPGPRGCNCLCLAHVRKCCVLHASHPPSDWYFRTFYRYVIFCIWLKSYFSTVRNYYVILKKVYHSIIRSLNKQQSKNYVF